MPKNYIKFFKDIAECLLKEENFQIPDPLVGDASCQERALYFSDLFGRKKIENFSEEEKACVGAAFFLTLATKRQYDGLCIILPEYTIDKKINFPINLNQSELNEYTKEARFFVATVCSRKTKELLPVCDYTDRSGKEFKKQVGGIPLVPFYASAFSSIQLCKTLEIPIVLYNIKIIFDLEKKEYTFDKDDLLVFMVVEGVFKKSDVALNPEEPVFFIKSFQMQVSDQPFMDDIEALIQEKASIESVLYKLAAVHIQLPEAKDLAEVCFMHAERPILFGRQITCLKESYSTDLSAAQLQNFGSAQYIVSKNPLKRTIVPISLSIDHIVAAFYRDVQNVVDSIRKQPKSPLLDGESVVVNTMFDPPDVHAFCRRSAEKLNQVMGLDQKSAEDKPTKTKESKKCTLTPSN